MSGCSPYALTIEQLEQKAEKKRVASDYVVVQDFSGRACDRNFDWTIQLSCFFCADEQRLGLKAGERVKVTRSEGKWFYGWRNTEESANEREPVLRLKKWKNSAQGKRPERTLPEESAEDELPEATQMEDKKLGDKTPVKKASLEKGWFPVDALKKISVEKKKK